MRSVYGVWARSAAVRIGIVATWRSRCPWNERAAAGSAVTESIRKWRGPFEHDDGGAELVGQRRRRRTRSTTPAGQWLSPIVFQTVALAVGRRALQLDDLAVARVVEARTGGGIGRRRAAPRRERRGDHEREDARVSR